MGTDIKTMNAPWPHVEAVHGEPEGPAMGALLPYLRALFVGEEVGADEPGVLTAEERLVRRGAAAGGGRDGPGCLVVGTVPVPVPMPMPPGGGPQKPQQRLGEEGDTVQHLFNSSAVEGHAPGPSVAVAGVFRTRGQGDVYGRRCVAIHSQSETARARLARGSDVTTHLSHGS